MKSCDENRSLAAESEHASVWDSAEAGEFLQLHPKTVEKMARAGELPAHPIGSGKRVRWRFFRSELLDWLRSRVFLTGHPCRQKEISRCL
jgi:excisionase family DNA binding protein